MTKAKSKYEYLEHVVVLMLENRSFDNILGYLSPKVNGVLGKDGQEKDLWNPAPIDKDGKPVDGGKPVHVGPGGVMDNPNPDPGEFYPHVNTQLFNRVSPESNAYEIKAGDFKPPYNLPSPVPATPAMKGFVQDYYNNYIGGQQGHLPPTREEYEIIMNCFPSHLVPASSSLAKSFAVCDKWFCAVPSQTFCNRSFFNAGTSNGWVTNSDYTKWLGNDNETIFNRLQDKGIPWAIYYDAQDVFPLTLLIHFPKLWPHFLTHFHHMDRFYEDAKNGTLPAYSFIEPRLFVNHNDQHPPIQILGLTQPSTVTAGEKLIHNVYDAVRLSDTPQTSTHPRASNWQNTLLTITYDEHGGCYDHVPPPAATPPDSTPGQMDFTFDRLGVRVATLMVSAWTSQFNVVSQQLQHTSMIRTLCENWSLDCLTPRDQHAPTFLDVFDLKKPRHQECWPTVEHLDQPAEAEGKTNHDHPLNDLQKAIVGTVNGLGKGKPSDLSDKMTVRDAIDFMREKKAELDAM